MLPFMGHLTWKARKRNQNIYSIHSVSCTVIPAFTDSQAQYHRLNYTYWRDYGAGISAANACSNLIFPPLTLVNTYSFSASIAVLGKHAVEARQAIGFPVSHYVPLAAKLEVTLVAGEVLHVPSAALGLRALIGEDYLEKKKD